MTALLELRENLKKIYSRNEAFITPVIKFLLSFIVLSIINGKMGYMTKLDNMAIVLIVSLLCSFLPTGFIALFARCSLCCICMRCLWRQLQWDW